MDKKEFVGDLLSIDPDKIYLNKDDKDEVSDFFLFLALFYNDLKSLVLFPEILKDVYRHPEPGEVSVHAAEFSALLVHNQRLAISVIREFFTFIKDNATIVRSPAFQKILKSSKSSVKNNWNQFFSIAIGELEGGDIFLNKLIRIRNKTGFHYDRKVLASSFKNLFFVRTKNVFNSKLYYSLGKNMEETRFYYADAVSEENTRKIFSGKSEDVEPIQASEYLDEVNSLMAYINAVIPSLIRTYLKNRPKRS